MLAKEADQLKKGDRVLARNGPYTQDATVLCVRKDTRGNRWISYQWRNPKGQLMRSEKLYNSVYLPA
ncbi:hypothetical protein ES704_02074 [subsurface metagenome]|jgi:hypothetical protein